MMQKIAKFEKVSFEEFLKDIPDDLKNLSEDSIHEFYDNIKLPTRATSGSAGYDFKAPFDFNLNPGETIKIPTGVRVKINEGWMLSIYPRSGLGFKYRLQLDNTVGIIDSDYYYSDNEGHIMVKLTNDSKTGKTLEVLAGNGFAQGIFVEYGITENDDEDKKQIRNGGFGSTTK